MLDTVLHFLFLNGGWIWLGVGFLVMFIGPIAFNLDEDGDWIGLILVSFLWPFALVAGVAVTIFYWLPMGIKKFYQRGKI